MKSKTLDKIKPIVYNQTPHVPDTSESRLESVHGYLQPARMHGDVQLNFEHVPADNIPVTRNC